MTVQRESPEDPDEEFGVHPLHPTRQRRSLLIPIAVAVALLTAGSALAFFLFAVNSDSPASVASSRMPAPLTEATGVKLQDFRDFKQRLDRAQQSTEQLLNAQQSELSRLSDQLNILAAKVDLLQRPVATVDLPSPPSLPIRTPPARKKNVTSPKPAASDISVGGAPLRGR